MKAVSLLAMGFLIPLITFSGGGGEKKTVNLEIKGMTCDGCVSMVENSVKKIEGVTAINVDLEKGLAVIQYDPAKVKEESIIAAVESAGGTRHSFRAKKLDQAEESTPACCKPVKPNKELPDCCKPFKAN